MTKPSIPALPCLCANLRRAARSLTQRYEEALRPHGLRGSQFTILQVLSYAGELTQGQLGEILAMDSTTLTRTLAIMSRQQWVAKRRGTDKREWRLRLTKAGTAKLEQALPAWQKVQQEVKQEIGTERWGQLINLATDLTTAISLKEDRYAD